jgi:hypothetical protein
MVMIFMMKNLRLKARTKARVGARNDSNVMIRQKAPTHIKTWKILPGKIHI